MAEVENQHASGGNDREGDTCASANCSPSKNVCVDAVVIVQF
jgi:hypothetical protein